jgi:hypothetical protein
MNVERFKKSPSGRMLKGGRGQSAYWAFVPQPLPPALTLDAKLVRALSEADLHGIFVSFREEKYSFSLGK